MKFRELLLFLLLPIKLLAGEMSDLEEAKSKVELANQNMDRFNRELIWFFDDKDKGMLEFEKSLKEKGLWEGELLENQELRIKISATRDLFKELRARLMEVLSLPYNTHAGRSVVEASVYLDATDEFISFVEERLFPQGWREKFKDYETKSIGLKPSGD